jgi:actin-like ATPase involved in cell morphogenesis
MFDDPDVTNHPKIYGVKVGSKYTVVTDGETIRREVTAVRKRPVDLKGNFVYDFSTSAEGWSDSLYPLKQGVPRNDAMMSISESIQLTKAFTNWLLSDIPEDAGIVVCLPLIKDKEGLGALKSAIRKSTAAKKGLQFFSEAWGAALGTILIREAVGTNVLTMNFGSSTVEVTMHASKVLVESNVYTFGGGEIDKRLINAIEQSHRAKATESDARAIKEQYSWIENNSVPAVLSKEGAKHDVVVSGDVIRKIVSNAIDHLVNLIRTQFLRAAEMSDPAAVNSLQATGRGYLVLCGGMVNMPGFAIELYDRLVGIGAINDSVILAVPEDGVIAPAIGAWKVGQVLEQARLENGFDTWDQMADESVDTT